MGPSPEELLKLMREFPDRMREAQADIEDTYGPDGMREVLGIARELDPVALASIAAHLVPEKYSPQEDRKALVRAAMLLSEAQEIVKHGPTIFDVPRGALLPIMRFWNHPANQELDAINQCTEPKKRFTARAKFITRQDRPGRAETDLFEALGEWAKERSETDISAYKREYKELLSASDVDFRPLILLRDSFSEWKAKSKREKAAIAAKKARSKAVSALDKKKLHLTPKSAKRSQKSAKRSK